MKNFIVLLVVCSATLSAQTTWINVKNPPYNAAGNGSTDDTDEIQAALDACPRSDGTNYSGSCQVRFPVKNYGANQIVIRNTGFTLTDFPPAASYKAMQMYCSNCTTATICTTGGAGHMAQSDGTNWRCD